MDKAQRWVFQGSVLHLGSGPVLFLLLLHEPQSGEPLDTDGLECGGVDGERKDIELVDLKQLWGRRDARDQRDIGHLNEPQKRSTTQ